MTQRESWLVPLLTLITCGFYGWYWHYKATEELKVLTGRADLSGLKDILLGAVTCNFYVWYAEYRNAQIVTTLMQQRGVAHQDRSQTVLILNVLTPVLGVTGYVARKVLQDEYNEVAATFGPPAPVAR